MVPLAGVIDLPVERARLNKEIAKLHKDLKRTNAKLGNANFLAKAPPTVVAKERDKGDAQQAKLSALNEQLRSLEQLAGAAVQN